MSHSITSLQIYSFKCCIFLLFPYSKIGKLTLARLLMANNSLMSVSCSHDRTDVHYEEILSLYDDLMKIDPSHICYYEDERSLVLLKQVSVSFSLNRCNENHYQSGISKTKI